MQIPWISGIRPPATTDIWQERVYAALVNRFSDGISHPRTTEAESGLDIRPSVYWYVMRSSQHFGFIVFVWHESAGVKWTASDGAVTPFDTGGLWHGRISTVVPLTDVQKRDLVVRVSTALPDWRDSFERFLAENYDRPDEYVNGLPPRKGVPEIRYDGNNRDPAWTWEARVRKDACAGQWQIAAVYWTEEDRLAFAEWLTRRDDLDELEVVHLLRRLAEMSTTTPPDELPSATVQRHLSGVARNGG